MSRTYKLNYRKTYMPKEQRPLMYHKELASLGPVRITVDGAPRTPKGKDFELIDITVAQSGQPPMPVSYFIENPECKKVFVGHKGQTFTVVAEGFKAAATLTYVGESGAATPPPPVAQPAAAPAAQSPAVAPYVSHAPPADAEGSLRSAKVFVARRLSLAKITLKAALSLQKDAKASGVDIPWDMIQSINASLFISADRAGLADAMPTSVDFATLSGKAQTNHAAAPQSKPVFKCASCGADKSTADAKCVNPDCATNKPTCQECGGPLSANNTCENQKCPAAEVPF